MSKICLNDRTKKYNEYESTPRGYGYSATAEKINTIMKGTDNNYYYVIDTKLHQRWKRISFDDVKINCLNNVLYPAYIMQNTEEETGLEDKFGGKVPFFIQGEEWPETNGIPMVFICQFTIPHEKYGILFRLFLPIDDENKNKIENMRVSKVSFNKETIKRQIHIQNNTKTIFPIHLIQWKLSHEFIQYDDLCNKLNIPEEVMNDERIYNNYFCYSLSPKDGIKLYGTGVFCNRHKESKKRLLQLTESKLFPYKYHNADVIHIYDDLTFYYDSYYNFDLAPFFSKSAATSYFFS